MSIQAQNGKNTQTMFVALKNKKEQMENDTVTRRCEKGVSPNISETPMGLFHSTKPKRKSRA